MKSRTRNIVYSRSSRDQPLSLSILGGKENGSSGIFVSDVQRGSRVEKIGLKRGDQVCVLLSHMNKKTENKIIIKWLSQTEKTN